MAGGKEMAWRLRIDFTDGTSELDDEIYETEDEAMIQEMTGMKDGNQVLRLLNLRERILTVEK